MADNNNVTMFPQMALDTINPSALAPPTVGPSMAPDSAAPTRDFSYVGVDNTPTVDYAENATQTVKYGVPSIAAGLVDTFGQSLGLIDDNKMSQLLGTALPAWGDYYSRNKEPVRTISDITGMLIPGTLGMKLVQSTAKLRNVISEAGFAGKLVGSLLHSGQEADEILAGVSKAALLAGNQGVRNFTTGLPEFDALRRSALWASAGDRIKEMVGSEVAIAATMNASDTIYPPDQTLSSYLVMNGVMGAVPVAADFMFMRRGIGKAIAASAANSEKVLNPAKINWSDLDFLPGNRDLGITSLALSRDAQTSTLAEATGDTTLLDNLNRAVISGDQVIKKQLGAVAQDSPFSRYGKTSLTSKLNMSDQQMNTARNLIQDDPMGLLGTISFEDPSYNSRDIEAFYKNKTEYADKLKADAEAATVKAGIASAAGDTDEAAKQFAQSAQLLNEKTAVDGSQEFVLERSGEQTPLMMRKPRFTDGNWGLKVDVKRATQNEPTVYSVKGITDDYYQGEEGVGVTGDFFVLLPKVEPVSSAVTTTKKVTTAPLQGGSITLNVPVPMAGNEQVAQVMRANVKQIVRPQDLALPENQQTLLMNLGKVFNWQDGQLGKPIYDGLTSDIKSAIRSWTGSSNSGPLRQWERDGAQQFQQLYNAYEPMRQQLRELKISGSDGTIPLWRGESAAETKNPTNNLVSMSTSYKVAQSHAYGGNITRVWVPIDDIVASAGFSGISGGEHEMEFIVKNNLQRRVGNVETQLGSTKQVHVPVT